jgi:hypothetical protein
MPYIENGRFWHVQGIDPSSDAGLLHSSPPLAESDRPSLQSLNLQRPSQSYYWSYRRV